MVAGMGDWWTDMHPRRHNRWYRFCALWRFVGQAMPAWEAAHRIRSILQSLGSQEERSEALRLAGYCRHGSDQLWDDDIEPRQDCVCDWDD